MICVILIYITIEYIYLRIKLNDLIQGYMKIKGEEETHSSLAM